MANQGRLVRAYDIYQWCRESFLGLPVAGMDRLLSTAKTRGLVVKYYHRGVYKVAYKPAETKTEPKAETKIEPAAVESKPKRGQIWPV